MTKRETYEKQTEELLMPLVDAHGFELVEVRTYRAIQHQKEFTGILNAWDKGTVTLLMEDGTEMKFAREDIALIRLAFDF